MKWGPIFITEDLYRSSHIFIQAMTGAKKTTTEVLIAQQRIARKDSTVVFIQMKPDRFAMAALQQAALDAELPFYCLNFDEGFQSDCWNPCAYLKSKTIPAAAGLFGVPTNLFAGGNVYGADN